VLVEKGFVHHAEARGVEVVNNVGAGDALLAGCLAAFTRGTAGQDALAEAVAWSGAACRSPGTRMRPVEAGDRAAVMIHAELDRARRIGA
jgi:fructose-1-phosphate kinase PfkB-like protein